MIHCVLNERDRIYRRRQPVPPHRARHRHRRRRPRLVGHPGVGEAETGRDGAQAHRGARRGDCGRDGLSQIEGAKAAGYE